MDPDLEPRPNDPVDDPDNSGGPDNPDPEPDAPEVAEKIIIRLSDEVTRSITVLKAISFLDIDGNIINAQEFITRLYGELPNFFKSEEELRNLWSDPLTRESLLNGLAEKGFPLGQLNELRIAINAEKCDIYDVLAYIKFSSLLTTRQERANSLKNTLSFNISDSQSEFLDYILKQYINNDFNEFDSENYPSLISIYYKSLQDGVAALGSPSDAINFFINIQRELYAN
jgi:type I restriction enzyme R subunit